MLKFLLASASLYTAQATVRFTTFTYDGGGAALTNPLNVVDPIGSVTGRTDRLEDIIVTHADTTYVGLFANGVTMTSHTEQATGGPVTKVACTTAATCILPFYKGGDTFNPVDAGAYDMYAVNGNDLDYTSSLELAGVTQTPVVINIPPYISAWGSTLVQEKTPASNVVERGDDVLIAWNGLAAGNVIEIRANGETFESGYDCGVDYHTISTAEGTAGSGTITLKTGTSGTMNGFAIPANYDIIMYTTAPTYTNLASCDGSTPVSDYATRQVQVVESDTIAVNGESGGSPTANVEAGSKLTVTYNVASPITDGTYVGIWASHATTYAEIPTSHTVDASGTTGQPIAVSFLPVGISGAGSIELQTPIDLAAGTYIVYMFNTNDNTATVPFTPLAESSYGVHGKTGPAFGVTAVPATITPTMNSDLVAIAAPTGEPTGQPSSQPSGQPSGVPTSPTGQPTGIPTSSPSFVEEPWGEYVWTEKRHRKAGMCENQCSGHGTCEVNGNCKCFTGLDGEDEWTGPDCSSRTCPFDFAWVGSSINSNNLHPWAECSNKGICDRSSGECQCFTGYEGAACQRTVCPDNCNDQGTCWPEKHLASKAGRVYEAPWDAMKHVGCLCDAGYRGPACDQQECPSGADPLSGYGNEAGRDCSGRGICDYSNGICACFTGFFGTRCQHQTTVM